MLYFLRTGSVLPCCVPSSYMYSPSSCRNVSSLTCTLPAIPVCSKRFAISTSLDQISYCNLQAPNTPDNIRPVCTPMRISMFSFRLVLNNAIGVCNIYKNESFKFDSIIPYITNVLDHAQSQVHTTFGMVFIRYRDSGDTVITIAQEFYTQNIVFL